MDKKIKSQSDKALTAEADRSRSQQVNTKRPHSPPAQGEYFGSVWRRALKRRSFLKGVGAGAAVLAVTPALLNYRESSARTRPLPGNEHGRRLAFETVPPGNEPDVVVPPHYGFNVLLRWGDSLYPEAPAFDVNHQTKEAQAQQFGFNCDLLLWYPLPEFFVQLAERGERLAALAEFLLNLRLPHLQKRFSQRALLAVNHEYTTGGDMFPGYDPNNPTQDQCEVEIEAHGVTIAELAFDGRDWRFVRDSRFNRRITGSTEIQISGPLRGHELMKTAYDPDGAFMRGMLNNCAGGRTPWGTVLSCEENFDQYFGQNDLLHDAHPSKALSIRIAPEGGETARKWERFDRRFDVSKEPNEYNRFGYVVEIDPYDPESVPQKRTALGRFKHEGAVPRLTQDGRVAVYSGDDARFEYVYKFVSHGRYSEFDRQANRHLLDEGTLYVARFEAGDDQGDEMGSGRWIPLVQGQGPLVAENGFPDQASILINTRGAADLVGATPMDRPEDIEVSPLTGRVYIVLTNNSRRTEDSQLQEADGRLVDTGEDETNPRGPNPHGHIIELIEEGDDAGSTVFRWNIFIKCGDPKDPTDASRFGEIEDPVAAGVSPISDPDNLIFDDEGNLWIATDGQFFSGEDGFGQNDGVFAVPVEGEERGLLRQFLSSVPGAEVCGPEFSGDNRTFFCAIQHPHEGEAFEKLWPLDEAEVSKPGVIAVRHQKGLKIGR